MTDYRASVLVVAAIVALPVASRATNYEWSFNNANLDVYQ
jgi:hypothetical protein